jgi:putative PIN family toxin of toxin-antitoxin system
MKVVLDTNVAVSAAISPKGPPAEIVKAWRAHSLTWVTSPPLLDELERALLSPRIRRYLAWGEDEIAEFLAAVRQAAEITSPTRQIDVIRDDPADNGVLEAAVSAQADYVVSGDRHLLELKTYEGVQIVTPARFVAILAATSP